MSSNEERPSSFIIGSRFAGQSFLTSIKGYSLILEKNLVGEMSDTHRKALKVVFDCCDTPMKSWTTLSELIEQNDDGKIMKILGEVDHTGQSYLERNFIYKSLASMEIAQDATSTILEQAEKLTEEQRHYVEIIHENCQREIAVWKEIVAYFS